MPDLTVGAAVRLDRPGIAWVAAHNGLTKEAVAALPARIVHLGEDDRAQVAVGDLPLVRLPASSLLAVEG